MRPKAIQGFIHQPEWYFSSWSKVSKCRLGRPFTRPCRYDYRLPGLRQACKKALDFAQKDGQTAVVILSDHGNSRPSALAPSGMSGFDKLSKEQLFGNLLKMNRTAEGLAGLL
jgi:hypothetical protein